MVAVDPAMFAGIDLSKTALVKNSNGSPPNFENPPNLKAVTYGVCIAMIVVSAAFVTLRLWTNFRMNRRFPVDDYFCITGWIITTTHCLVIMSVTRFARHAWDIPISFFDADWSKRMAVLSMEYGPALWIVKTTVFTMYLRLFGSIPWMRRACWAGILFFGLVYWSYVPVQAVLMFPHRGETWGLLIAMKRERPTSALNFLMAVANVLSDLYALILPLPAVLPLKLSRQKKTGLFALFSLGFIALGCSIVGAVYRILLHSRKIITELYVTLIVSSAPACVAAWRRSSMRDSKLVLSLKSWVSRYRQSQYTTTTRPSFVRTPIVKSSPAVIDVQVEPPELKTLRKCFVRFDGSEAGSEQFLNDNKV
ncbi:hypothetical protein EK21DRAFT_112740 [Setomelanomma holmii]|uniref:Rhodopsin domain-containing protein n=1 Tax=Setomelanomma holmii TaxID=210430 RepID=A0A9P4H8Y2_9PLEO|nr:hypothetical protein EK21DRAFT_112740 [Setomelanomma holmii]